MAHRSERSWHRDACLEFLHLDERKIRESEDEIWIRLGEVILSARVFGGIFRGNFPPRSGKSKINKGNCHYRSIDWSKSLEIFKGIELIDYITVLLENIAFLKRMFLLEKYGDMEIQRQLSRYFRDVIDRKK